jgi:hypothetical protein
MKPLSTTLKFAFLGAIVAAFLLLTGTGSTLRRAMGSMQQSPPASPLPVRGVAFPAMGNLTGKWQGQSASIERGMCTLAIDLEERLGQFAAYATLTCYGNTPALRGMNQSLTILSGSSDKLSVSLHVVKTVGAPGGGCPLASLALTPFGSGTLAAEWRDGCRGGEMVLRRVR